MQTANLPKAIRLYQISQGSFTLQDYSRTELTAQIFIKGFNEPESIEISPADILDCAIGLGIINSFYDPSDRNPNYMVEDDLGPNRSFQVWWEGLSPHDVEDLFSKAIASQVEYGLNRIHRKLTGKYAPKLEAA